MKGSKNLKKMKGGKSMADIGAVNSPFLDRVMTKGGGSKGSMNAKKMGSRR